MVTLKELNKLGKNYEGLSQDEIERIRPLTEKEEEGGAYLYNLFAPDNRRYSIGESALIEAGLGQFLGNLEFEFFTGIVGSGLKEGGKAAGKTMKSASAAARKATFRKARKEYAKVSGELVRKNKELYKRAFLTSINDPNHISTEEFIAGIMNNGRKANSLFMSFVDEDDAAEFLKKSLRNLPEQVLGKGKRDKLAEKWVKGKLTATDIRDVLKAGQDAWEPIYLFMHAQTTGDTFRKVLELPATRFWLKNKGYNVDELYKNADKLGFLHDFGKMMVPHDLINSKEHFRDMGKVGKAMLDKVREHEKLGRELLEPLFGAEWKEELKKMGFTGVDEAGTIFSFFGGEDSLAKLAQGHGVKGNNTPLEVLFGLIDRADAAHNVRSYTKGGKMTSESLEDVINAFLYGNKYETGIRNSGGMYPFDIPDNVIRELKEEMPDIWNSSKVGMDDILGNLVYNVETATKVPLKDRLVLAHGSKLESLGDVTEKLGKGGELFTRGIQRVPETVTRKDSLFEGIHNTVKDNIRISNVRSNAYNKYHDSVIKDKKEDEDFPAFKEERKYKDFIKGTVGLNPRANISKIRSWAASPDRALKYLKQFNRNFQESDYSDDRKEAIQYIVDNFYDLSEDDQSYFLDDISKRYSDVRNSPDYKYIDYGLRRTPYEETYPVIQTEDYKPTSFR